MYKRKLNFLESGTAFSSPQHEEDSIDEIYSLTRPAWKRILSEARPPAVCCLASEGAKAASIPEHMDSGNIDPHEHRTFANETGSRR